MTDRLTTAQLVRMQQEHVAVEHYVKLNGEELPDVVLACVTCFQDSSDQHSGDDLDVDSTPWPCDAARLLAHFMPDPVPHLADIAYGLCGPSLETELGPKGGG